jgi:hypothetical protein
VARRECDVRPFVEPDATLAELPGRIDESRLDPGRYAATARVTDRMTGIETEAETATFGVR